MNPFIQFMAVCKYPPDPAYALQTMGLNFFYLAILCRFPMVPAPAGTAVGHNGV